jgi:hypothetical protein
MSIFRLIKDAIHVQEHSKRQEVDSEDKSGVVIWPGPIYLRNPQYASLPATNLFVVTRTQTSPRDSFSLKSTGARALG